MSLAALWFLLPLASLSLQTANAALAPRQSSSVSSIAPYWPENWLCPSARTWVITDYEQITSADPTVGTLTCTPTLLGASIKCQYFLANGTIVPAYNTTGSYCNQNGYTEATAASSATCGWMCPLYGTAGDSIDRVAFEPNQPITCAYLGDKTHGCSYSTTTGALSTSTTQGSTCPPSASWTCPSRRRRYRSEDNYTAMLKKKALRAEKETG
ncbi:hypothetical protein HMN09_00357500 [Mycena chlorophos]|uniref:Uncharacterized protein n=1 Tax=Mycena chlorophos TaxID=658473 RepID=A0A8H6WKW6_MYCCL|nr:hypothetical protein HMN09_00357500 [Mycena chlorophos]